MTRYLPKEVKLTFEKKLTDFPTNKLYGLSNAAVIRTIKRGEDERFVTDLRETKKKVNGVMVQAYSESEMQLMVVARFVISWTFKDLETGETLPINAETLGEMHDGEYENPDSDFIYLMTEVGKVMNPKAIRETNKPKGETTDDEKKS